MIVVVVGIVIRCIIGSSGVMVLVSISVIVVVIVVVGMCRSVCKGSVSMCVVVTVD